VTLNVPSQPNPCKRNRSPFARRLDSSKRNTRRQHRSVDAANFGANAQYLIDEPFQRMGMSLVRLSRELQPRIALCGCLFACGTLLGKPTRNASLYTDLRMTVVHHGVGCSRCRASDASRAHLQHVVDGEIGPIPHELIVPLLPSTIVASAPL